FPWLLGKRNLTGNVVSRVRDNKVINHNPNGRGATSFGGLFSLNTFFNASATLYSYKANQQRIYGIDRSFGESTGQGIAETLQLAKREIVFRFDAKVKQCLLIKLKPHTAPPHYQGELMGITYPISLDHKPYENFHRRLVVKRFERKKLSEYDQRTFEDYKKEMEYEIVYQDVVNRVREFFGDTLSGQQKFVEFRKRIGPDFLIRNESAAYLCLDDLKEKEDLEERYYTVNHIFLPGASSITQSQRFAHPYTTAMRGEQNWDNFERFIRENDVFYIVRERALRDKYYHREEKTNDLQKYYEAELLSENNSARDILEQSFPEADGNFEVNPDLEVNYVNSEESSRYSHPGVLIDNYSSGLLRKEFETVQEFARDLQAAMEEEESIRQEPRCNFFNNGPIFKSENCRDN
ncbi:MAG: hypothetical protein OXB84_04230, partial [Halobacteriovoraceae bacterium]|nr:hypothetical protein [Halobacteriovoraceae bacterium]